jgi:hypothetical protein
MTPAARGAVPRPPARRTHPGSFGEKIYPERELATAAATDPALAGLHAEARRQRYFGSRLVADRLGELGALADPETAPDTIYALCGHDVYLLLVEDRGWTPDLYEVWLATQLIRSLLAQPAAPASRPGYRIFGNTHLFEGGRKL